MRYKILLYGLITAAITSCSSVYKASQTPDDVYYSPARQGVNKQAAKKDKYEDYVAAEDDRYLRMKVRDRQRWDPIDDYTYWNDSRYVPSYNYNYDYYRNSPFSVYAWNSWNFSPYSSFYYNPYMSFGYGAPYASGLFYPSYGYGHGYNPYGPTYIVKNPSRVLSPSVNRPNLNSYRNGLYNNTNRSYNNQGSGSTLKRVFAPNENARMYNNNNNSSNSGNNNSYSAPQRSYSPSSSGSSSSGSSGSSSGVSRPPR